MSFHRNAKLGLAGRFALVGAIEGGLSMRAAAVASTFRRRRRTLVAPLAARRLEQDRRTLACLVDRSSRRTALRGCSRPSCRSASALPARDRLGAAAGRRRDRLRALDGLEGACAGPGSRGRRGRAREPANSYEWPCPGDLLHMDV